MGIGEQPASSIFQEIRDIELDGIMGNELVIMEELTPPDGRSRISFTIQRFDTGLGSWRNEYVWIADNHSSADIENECWNITKTPAVLLKAQQRNGDISYRVVGTCNGSLYEFIARDSLPQGNSFFYGGSIIEQAEGQYSIWVMTDGKLALNPY
ncbi:MAG: hypothetical protein KBA53_08815 [Thermoclostridium sp.]|nr:hypothetical protein [Thermoclostridium sp.]